MLLPKWGPQAPFADLSTKPCASAGVIAQDRDGLGIASVLVRRGQYDAFACRMKEQWGIDLLSGPRRSSVGDLGFIGTGPDSWLAMSERAGSSFAGALAVALGDCVSVADQSDGQAVLRLSGPRVREVLSKLVPIDLHPRSCPIGNVSVTIAAHMSVTVWRLEGIGRAHV